MTFYFFMPFFFLDECYSQPNSCLKFTLPAQQVLGTFTKTIKVVNPLTNLLFFLTDSSFELINENLKETSTQVSTDLPNASTYQGNVNNF